MFGVGFHLTRWRWWVKRGKRDGAVGEVLIAQDVSPDDIFPDYTQSPEKAHLQVVRLMGWRGRERSWGRRWIGLRRGTSWMRRLWKRIWPSSTLVMRFHFPKRCCPAALANRRLATSAPACLAVIASVQWLYDWLDGCRREFHAVRPPGSRPFPTASQHPILPSVLIAMACT